MTILYVRIAQIGKLLCIPLCRSIFRRKYDYSECSSEKCPVKSDDAMSNYVCNMTLHHPDIAVNESELIEQSIKE